MNSAAPVTRMFLPLRFILFVFIIEFKLFRIYGLQFTVDEFTVTLLISLDCGEIAVNTLGNLTTGVVHPDRLLLKMHLLELSDYSL